MQPSISEFVGGLPTFQRLTNLFYAKVKQDELLAPVFSHFNQDHIHHVALWLDEVFGGPEAYTQTQGGHRGMITHHLALHLNEAQRQRWADLMIESAQAVLPADDKLQRRFAAYIQWGTGIALRMSQMPKDTPLPSTPSPKWGWEESESPKAT